jgi:hypothetical protein
MQKRVYGVACGGTTGCTLEGLSVDTGGRCRAVCEVMFRGLSFCWQICLAGLLVGCRLTEKGIGQLSSRLVDFRS